jgi:ankyrin repeat protein
MKQDAVAAFCRALWRGEMDVVTRMAPLIDPNGCDRWGHTPLSMAVQYGDLPLVSLLVRRGAEVNQGRRFLTPVTLAARRGDSSMVEYLRNAGAVLSILTWVYLGQDDLVAQELARAPMGADLRDEAGTPLIHPILVLPAVTPSQARSRCSIPARPRCKVLFLTFFRQFQPACLEAA